MAPQSSPASAPTSTSTSASAPLADWFFIAGVDGDSLQWPTEANGDNRLSIQIPHEPTILEDEDETFASMFAAKRDHRDSLQSTNKRASVQSVNTVQSDGVKSGTASNRSSATIKAPKASDGDGTFDFDSALRKFTNERDTFLVDLSLSAGVVSNTKPKARPKTQRVVGDEIPQANSLRSSIGSIKRRISIRDMSSLRRQSTVSRQSSVRTSRRLSNYNSVMPSPQPLNLESNMHPLKRRFEPVLLDRYPPKSMVEEAKRRPNFPDYVPMFTFPNDVNVVSADERPRATWHGFAMTGEDGARLYGVCIIMWIPLNDRASEELETRCEEWRKQNMTDEERELAASLGERLATERAKLSALLSQLSNAPSGTEARDNLDEAISLVEEKINMMTDILRPVRHGAASKIDGLTDGETGLWVPRAYGVLGRDSSMTTFWKEWLKAVVVPMTNGKILRVPPSSPRTGLWQPLERYVVNLFVEAPSPLTSKTQTEVAVRELRLFARKEAVNELPGSRNTDLYGLFRALSIPNIVILFELVLSESRIILLSSYTSMLHVVSKALIELLYPFTWPHVYIPVLPARLLSVLEAPCPYIVGVERRYENLELPEDDFVLVDLDADTIDTTALPTPLPRQQRRKLTSLLQVAAPHHNRMGVHLGPPPYVVEAFPFDAFFSESAPIFDSNPPPTSLSKYAGLNSSSFGEGGASFAARPPIYNAFLQSKAASKVEKDRPPTSTASSDSADPPLSPSSSSSYLSPSTPVSRNDSGFSIQASLREKRSGHFGDPTGRRSGSFGTDRRPNIRAPPRPPFGHAPTSSVSTLHGDTRSNYAPSVIAPSTYAQSTIAASTVMPNVLFQPVHETNTTKWAEGHCLSWRKGDLNTSCSVCDDKAEDGGIHRCAGCGIAAHARCMQQICIVCSAAFFPDQVRAAFVRCFASLLYTYRKYLKPANSQQKKEGLLFSFDMDGFKRSMPGEQSEYIGMLQQAQAFNEFVHEREMKPANDPSILLFDQIILAKRNRGKTSFFGKSKTTFLSDSSEHLWRSMAATPPSSRFPGDYRSIITRVPAKLDPTLMKEPRTIQGAPRITTGRTRRKPIPSILSLNLNNDVPPIPNYE